MNANTPKIDVELTPEMMEAFGQALEPGIRYFDATELLKAMARRIEAQDRRIGELEELMHRIAIAARDTAQRLTEMRADLLAAGAFEKRSSIIMPGRKR